MTLKWKILLTLAIAFPYYKIMGWKYALATLVIIYIFQKFYGQKYKEKLGIDFKRRDLPYSLLVLILCALGTEYYIQDSLVGSGIIKTPPVLLGLWLFRPLFQSLNEEILLRALLLKWLAKKELSQWWANLTMALIFTSLHFLFCKALFNISLDPKAGAVLLFATLSMNQIYFKTSNVLYTWAIHFGINFSFFGGYYIRSNFHLLNDAEKFNLIYGSNVAVLVAALFCVFSFLCLRTRVIHDSH